MIRGRFHMVRCRARWGRYKGLYRTDKGIVFSYTVGDTQVLDMPSVEVHNGQRALRPHAESVSIEGNAFAVADRHAELGFGE